MKQYSLEIVPIYELESSGPPMAYYSRGHHQPAEFWAALWEHFYFERDCLLNYSGLRAEHWYMRLTPWDDEGQMWAQCPVEPGPGAFPVTYVDTCWIEERKKNRVQSLIRVQ